MPRSTHPRSRRDEEAFGTEVSDEELSFELPAEPSYEGSASGPFSIPRQSSQVEPKRTWASRFGGRSTKIAGAVLVLAAVIFAAATQRPGAGVSQKKKRNAVAGFVDGGERGLVSGGGGDESFPNVVEIEAAEVADAIVVDEQPAVELEVEEPAANEETSEENDDAFEVSYSWTDKGAPGSKRFHEATSSRDRRSRGKEALRRS